ncbi:hypothetical protein AWC38_SpisGene6626 [Stylophora pistillata]|uniref:Cystatin domain-containing protein n=1 Tax=Stylophora pistillata TaxID=50429 RepID=A0A2B4SHT6_STYPI|nr:hypothetical protein AWC38_SpisGene6626 [Stylophora pistillata]
MPVMTGGISRIDPEDSAEYPDLQKGVEIFMDKLNAKANAGTVYKLVCERIQASKQVVQGVLYRVAFSVEPVDKEMAEGGYCIKSDDITAEGNGKFVCITVWSRGWLGDQSPKVKENEEAKDVESCLKEQLHEKSNHQAKRPHNGQHT